ncbi:MAG: hypothetical protein AB8F74_03790 [Saprospiraceae bacterium]
MNIIEYLFLVSVMILLTSCTSTKSMDGLWQIDKVQMGSEEMTPIAKWTRLNKDKTQQSGNGWIQHTEGNWNYNKKTKSISLSNSNGPTDEFGDFVIKEINKEEMKWSRMEEGQEVLVSFKRVDELPQSPADQLLGVWKKKDENTATPESYLFFRWDHILIDRKSGENKKYGMYKTHGHKPELQIIYYGDPLKQVIWNFSYENDTLILERDLDGAKIVLEYERIKHIPK